MRKFLVKREESWELLRVVGIKDCGKCLSLCVFLDDQEIPYESVYFEDLSKEDKESILQARVSLELRSVQVPFIMYRGSVYFEIIPEDVADIVEGVEYGSPV